MDDVSDAHAQPARRDAGVGQRDARLALLYAQSGACIAETDLTGRFLEVTDRMCQLVGRSRAELLSLRLQDITHPEDLHGNVPLFEHLVRTGEPFCSEQRYVRPDGQVVWVALSVDRVVMTDGSPRVLAVSIDVTARKPAEARQRESEARFRAAVAAASDIVWTTDPDGRMVDEQLGWAAFTGQSASEYLDRGWTVAIHPDDVSATRQAWQAALAEESRFVFEHRVRRHDGQYRFCSVRALPVRDGDGRVREWVGVHTDVSDQRAADRALRVSEARYRSLFESMSEEVSFWQVVRAADGRIATWQLIDANPSALAVWGRRLDAVRGRSADEIFGAGATEQYRAPIEHVIKTGAPVSCEDWFPQLRRHLRMTLIPIGDGFIATATDVTHVKQAQALIEQQNEALRASDRRKDEFLATLAHELRNPLAPLRTALHILERSDNAALAVQARRIMHRQLGQMVRLIDDLLDVSRITTGKLQLTLERVPLNRVLQQAIETARPRIEARQHRLVVEPALHEVWLRGDVVRLAQVFTNLLNNAAKYSENGGTITLRVQVEAAHVRVSVHDTGIGLPPEALAQVFELFTQIDHGADKAQGGLGIGLSLVQRLVHMHGGTVEAASQGIGRGSSFTVQLPLAPALDGSAQSAAADAASGARRHILVADDNRDAADSLAIMLQLAGHEVQVAYDGASALQAVLQRRPQVAIIDIGMPQGDGHEVARAVVQKLGGERPLLLALSGWGQEVDKRMSAAAGFDHHLIKPVDVAQIEQILRARQSMVA